MSDDALPDDLDRAVDARLEAYRPGAQPPFEAIEERKRGKDRRRLLAAAASVAIVAVATAALAVPGPGRRPVEQIAVAPPSSAPASPAWDGRSGPLFEDGPAVSCVETYSPQTLTNRSLAFDGTVAAVGASISNRPDKGQLELTGVTFTVNTWYRGGTTGEVTVDLPPPASRSYSVGSRLLVSGEPRWAGEPLDRPIAWTACGGFTRYYDPETAQVWQDAFEAQDSPENLRLTSDGVRGATLCLADARGEFPEDSCRLIGKDGADRLTRALNGAQPQGRQPMCDATGATYRLLFDMPSARVIPIIIPTACGPITVGPGQYRINDRAARALDAEYAREAKYTKFINRCVGREDVPLAPAFVGLDEDKATREESRVLAENVTTIRVIGRDGSCLGRTRDLRSDRVNLIVMDGEVVWAGRF